MVFRTRIRMQDLVASNNSVKSPVREADWGPRQKHNNICVRRDFADTIIKSWNMKDERNVQEWNI